MRLRRLCRIRTATMPATISAPPTAIPAGPTPVRAKVARITRGSATRSPRSNRQRTIFASSSRPVNSPFDSSTFAGNRAS